MCPIVRMKGTIYRILAPRRRTIPQKSVRWYVHGQYHLSTGLRRPYRFKDGQGQDCGSVRVRHAPVLTTDTRHWRPTNLPSASLLNMCRRGRSLGEFVHLTSSQTKIAVKVPDEEQLQALSDTAKSLGVAARVIQDAYVYLLTQRTHTG